MQSKLNDNVVKDFHTINEKIMPDLSNALEENKIDLVSAAFYFSGFVKDILKDIEENAEHIDVRAMKELIIRYMLD